MGKKHFIYSGPLIQNNGTFLQKWEQDVWAKSAAQAKTFLINRAKSQFGDSYFNIDLSQLRDVTAGVYVTPRKKKCVKCGTQLTDGGYCPKCDDGVEDLNDSYKKHAVNEALTAEQRKFIETFVDRYVDYIDLDTRDRIVALSPLPLPSVYEWERDFGTINATQIMYLLKYCSPSVFKEILFCYYDDFVNIIDNDEGYDIREVIRGDKEMRLTRDDLSHFNDDVLAVVGWLPLPLDSKTIQDYWLSEPLCLSLDMFNDGEGGLDYVLCDYTEDHPLVLRFKNRDMSTWMDDCHGYDFESPRYAPYYPWVIADKSNVMLNYVSNYLWREHKENSPELVMAWCIGDSEFTVDNSQMQAFVDAGYNLSDVALNALNVSLANNGDADIVLHLDATNIQIKQNPLYLPVFDCENPQGDFPFIEHLYLNDSFPMEESIELNDYTSKYDPDEIRSHIKHIYYKNKEITVEELLSAYHRRWEHA